jgi:hypothetical protein
MKKILILSFAALTISFGAMSQSQPRIGIKGGWNLSTLTVSNRGSIDRDQSLSGYNIGVIVDLPLVPDVLSLQPGVFYTTKGSKLKSGDKNNSSTTPYTKYTTRPQYIEVPINFIGKIPVADRVRLFAGIGPYFAYGVAGKNKVTTTLAGVTTTTESNIKWGSDDNDNVLLNRYHRFDYGGNVQIGAEICDFLISAQYGVGFKRINQRPTGNSEKNQNRVFSVNVGYLF